MRDRPLRFGLLIEGYKTQIRNLIEKECRTQQIDLITIAGGSWIRSPYNNNEQERNSLYNLLNRRGFETSMINTRQLASREKVNCLLIYGDLDGLKTINDTHGHLEGDKAISETAKALTASFRDSDLICRMGGDEFIIFAYNSTIDSFKDISQRVNSTLAEQAKKLKLKYKIEITLGAAEITPNNNKSYRELIKEADDNLYKIKKKRKSSN